MSLLQHSLELFGFSSIDEITVENLKRGLKNALLEAHPDKGGNVDDIDKLLNSYVFLSENLQRLTGGRATLQNISSPDDLRGKRADEIINRIFEEFDNDKFNAEFEKSHIPENGRGYLDWLKSKDGANNLVEGQFGDATIQLPTFSESSLNTVFESTYKPGSAATNDIIIHPDQMAAYSGKNLGVTLIQDTGGCFTSEYNTKPEFTDVYAAFTTNNTLTDKVPTFKAKTLEQLLKEREEDLNPTDDDLAEITAWEKKKLDDQKKHLENIKQHFEGTSTNNLLCTNEENFVIHL
jgi:hypothetical protein